MRRISVTLVSVTVLCGIAGSVVPFSAVAADRTAYVLGDTSAFLDGCQGMCMCPVRLFSLEGSFVLGPRASEAGFDVFDVTEVHWVIVSEPLGDRWVEGSGTFRVRRDPEPVQRLELDLAVAGELPVHFDSGLVPLTAELPQIDVAIAKNEFLCYDHVFSIQARPEISVTTGQTTWGRVKARYREGVR